MKKNNSKSEGLKKKKNIGRFTLPKYDLNKLSEKEKANIKKFGNPRKLGFLRFVMILLGIPPIFIVFMAFSVTKDDIVVDVAFLNYLLDAIIYMVLFVMIWQRKKAIRLVGAIALSFDVVLTFIDFFMKVGLNFDSNNLTSLIFNQTINILLIIYFLCSRRVKYACTRPLNEKEGEKKENEIDYYNLKSWAFWRDLIIMFFIFSIVGHWMEFGYCTLIKFNILPGTVDPNNQIWSDFLFPFPIYGAGACACALIFYPIRIKLRKVTNNKFLTIVLVFIISGLVCSLMELIMGLFTNQDLQLWDYTNMFCKFMGQVCLQNSIGFALAATIVTYIVYPLVKDLFAYFDKYMNFVFVAVLIFGILLFIFYYFNYLPEQMKKADPNIYSEKVTVSPY